MIQISYVLTYLGNNYILAYFLKWYLVIEHMMTVIHVCLPSTVFTVDNTQRSLKVVAWGAYCGPAQLMSSMDKPDLSAHSQYLVPSPLPISRLYTCHRADTLIQLMASWPLRWSTTLAYRLVTPVQSALFSCVESMYSNCTTNFKCRLYQQTVYTDLQVLYNS